MNKSTNLDNELFYRDFILDLYKNPSNKGELFDYDLKSEGYNDSCGDKVCFTLKLKEDKIEDIKFDGSGCAISIAACSLLSDLVKGKSLEYVRKLKKETLFKLIKIPLSSVRVKCALLGLETLQNAIKK